MASVITRFVAKQLFGQKGAIANRKAVDFSAAKMAERLTNFGIDPRQIKTEKELVQLLNLVKQAEDQAFSKQFSNILGKSKIRKPAEVFDLQGKKIPDPEKNIMGGQSFETEEEIAERIAKQNKESIERLKEKRLKEKLEDADDLDPEEKADGGRIGFKKGMTRRTFLGLMGAGAALTGAAKTGLLKLLGKEGTKQVTKNIIKTDALPNKPEWFDALVTKVINEGEDITKKFSTGERQTVHKLDVDSFTDSKGNKVITEEVRVTQDPDTGEIRVEYLTPDSPGESQVDLVYKKPKPDEGDPNPSAEFYAVESEPRVVNYDGDIEFDGENLVNNVDELMTDTTKLKMIAKGDNKPTLKEFVQSKKKKDQVERLNTDTMNQVDYIETKYGPGPDPSDYVDDMAKGGLAGMLGE